jgi:hypothetical protein
MNIQILIAVSLLVVSLLSGCNSKPEISNFDEKAWKEDKNGCLGLRTKSVDLILNNQKKFSGKTERNLLKLLGKPDKTAFYKRNIRNFIYFTEPGAQCDSTGGKNGKRIIVELNAMGNVTWINEEII